MWLQQDTFDTVVAHLRRQRRKSLIACGSICALRGQDDAMCSVGALLPDEVYRRSMEGGIVCLDRHDAASVELTNAVMRLGHDPKLVRALQIVHDRYVFGQWERFLREVADEFRLKFVPE